jgi:ferric-dicitrate binding protein FerR (iron transport regulator)
MSDDDRPERLEARARAEFEASVDGLDAATRSRLNQARQRALAELREHPHSARGLRLWRPALALGAAAMLAVLLWRAPGSNSPADPAAAELAFDEIVFATDSEDLDLAREDLEFYAFVADAAQRNGGGHDLGNGSG